MKRICKIFVIAIAILFLWSSICFGASEVDIKSQIKQEEGSLFEKIIAECIGGIAQTILNFTTSDTMGVGFKDYDTLIFNNNAENDSLSPFTNELWNKAMDWYKIFAIISGSLILIAVFILAYKIMIVGMNTARKNEAKESLVRLIFGGVAIAFAPLFIRFLLFLNNAMVHLLVTAANSSSLEGFLGNNMLTSIRTGNAITTALVIAMFIYLFVKLNIKFIVRQFTIIIFTVFTPIACGLWIINKNVTAASIWAGQIIMNIFMQFIYCFLFIMYLVFLPTSGGWAISLIWAMMILPIADSLMNCLQNLTSRIAGINNEQMTNRVIGMGAMLGFGLGAIKEQFNTPVSNIQSRNGTSGSNGGMQGFISRAKSVISPSLNLSAEKDYEGNINPIRDVIPKEKVNSETPISTNNTNTQNTIINNNRNVQTSTIGKIAKASGTAVKTYLSVGAKMAEGSFDKKDYSYKPKNTMRNKYQDTEYTNKAINNKYIEKGGKKNE